MSEINVKPSDVDGSFWDNPETETGSKVINKPVKNKWYGVQGAEKPQDVINRLVVNEQTITENGEYDTTLTKKVTVEVETADGHIINLNENAVEITENGERVLVNRYTDENGIEHIEGNTKVNVNVSGEKIEDNTVVFKNSNGVSTILDFLETDYEIYYTVNNTPVRDEFNNLEAYYKNSYGITSKTLISPTNILLPDSSNSYLVPQSISSNGAIMYTIQGKFETIPNGDYFALYYFSTVDTNKLSKGLNKLSKSGLPVLVGWNQYYSLNPDCISVYENTCSDKVPFLAYDRQNSCGYGSATPEFFELLNSDVHDSDAVFKFDFSSGMKLVRTEGGDIDDNSAIVKTDGTTYKIDNLDTSQVIYYGNTGWDYKWHTTTCTLDTLDITGSTDHIYYHNGNEWVYDSLSCGEYFGEHKIYYKPTCSSYWSGTVYVTDVLGEWGDNYNVYYYSNEYHSWTCGSCATDILDIIGDTTDVYYYDDYNNHWADTSDTCTILEKIGDSSYVYYSYNGTSWDSTSDSYIYYNSNDGYYNSTSCLVDLVSIADEGIYYNYNGYTGVEYDLTGLLGALADYSNAYYYDGGSWSCTCDGILYYNGDRWITTSCIEDVMLDYAKRESVYYFTSSSSCSSSWTSWTSGYITDEGNFFTLRWNSCEQFWESADNSDILNYYNTYEILEHKYNRGERAQLLDEIDNFLGNYFGYHIDRS